MRVARITDKEKLILQNLAKGKTNKEISKEFNITKSTVEQYVRILMFKIPADNRAQLVYEATKKGIIE